MRQKTRFSVVEMKSENVAFVSENEGSVLGIPWPDGPCTVVTLPSRLARGRRTLEAPGSRPGIPQNQGVSPRASRRGFFRPQKHAPGFFGGPKRQFVLKTWLS